RTIRPSRPGCPEPISHPARRPGSGARDRVNPSFFIPSRTGHRRDITPAGDLGDRSPSGEYGDPPEIKNMPRWGFIGSGKMATALIKGMVRAGLASAESISASDPLPEARAALHSETGVSVFGSNGQVALKSDVLVLAVKPQSMSEALEDLREEVTDEHLVVSVAAGVTLASIDEGLGSRGRLVRVMPNTPALVGEGASAYAMGLRTVAEDE